jgi:general secretion pathway protein D
VGFIEAFARLGAGVRHKFVMPRFRSALIVMALAVTSWAADDARKVFEAAQRAERSGDSFRAYLLYTRAAALDPANRQYAAVKQALQARVTIPGETQQEQQPSFPHPAGADLVAIGELTPSELVEARQAVLPPQLNWSPERKSFNLRGEARTIIEQVAAAFGIQTSFGPDYQNPPQFTFRVEDVDSLEALRALETVSNSLFIPLGDHAILVERDTPQRRTEVTPSMAMAIPIPERMSVQEAQELVTAVQQTLEIRRVSVDPGRHLVFMRDQASKILAARTLFTELARGRAQVEIDLDLLAVTKTSSLHYGLTTPTMSPIVNFGDFLGNTVKLAAGFTNFLTFGGGATFLGFGVANAQLLADVSKSTASSVLKSQVVAVDGQATQMHVGDRYPIIVNGYYGNTTGTGQVYTPPPTVNFQDLGLVLKVTPNVHGAGEVSLEVEAEFNVLGADSANNIPIVSRRKYTGKVRLKFGEAAVVAGLVKTSVNNSSSGLPGVPRLLRNNSTDKEDTEVLLVLTPRLTNLPPWEQPSPPLYVGTESKPLTLY